jgi:hypothetical protein
MLTTLGILILNTTKASAFTFNEATAGDLPMSTSPEDLPQFILDSGLNTFSGEVSFTYPQLGVVIIDVDAFAFIVPTENTLESITINISSLITPNSDAITSIGFSLLGENLSTSEEEFRIPSENLSLFTSILPLENGLFLLASTRLAGGVPLGGVTRAAYTFSLNVIPSESTPSESIPEPSSVLSVLTFGALGVGAVRKRRCCKSTR